jgi:hypothetical protein
VNVPRIKGSHTAMKSGMLAAEAAFEAIAAERGADELTALRAGAAVQLGSRPSCSWSRTPSRLFPNSAAPWER